ncbi:protein phosphatase PTC7 homolog isoform X1 [Drosophila sulfurigaster albostrigata]|uniref:protein phosphatase PTC7 homolog isoform X1 n=2 Tax=Drosophila sulfurigaster albostrigata TaxID=89887 RepID=UPI002D21A781|nr:protein phosphatase PTC7 homolog isoform X1 [Drosophila sulfurigaster albostrigata]
MNEYLDNARRHIQRTVISGCDSLSETLNMTAMFASTSANQMLNTLMHLKALLLQEAMEFIGLSGRANVVGDSSGATGASGSGSRSSESESESESRQPRLVSVVCGFPKDIGMYPHYSKGQFGEDAWFSTSTDQADALGVADGVGGWRVYGIDPGQFSRFLMRSCERLAHAQDFEATRPEHLLARAYCNLLEQKQPILGSCTACVLTLLHDSSTLYAANIGDSGLLIIRDGAIVCRSMEQQHHFNTPYQLAVPPPGQGLNVLTDGPECAALLQFELQQGDVLILATDGVYDNVSEELLVRVLSHASGISDHVKLQTFANSIALMARSLSFNPSHDSPFSLNARRHNIDAPGGKPDDITVILASVV